MIQNAEDAGATHVKILYDEHQYPDDPKFLKNAKLAQFQVTHSERRSGRKGVEKDLRNIRFKKYLASYDIWSDG